MSAGAQPQRLETPTAPEAIAQLRDSFKSLMAALRRLRGRETHRPGELSFAQYSLLFELSGSRNMLSSREIAKEAALSPATVTQMLEALEAHGLVKRHRDEHDRRVVLNELTSRGSKVLAARHARMEPRFQAALAEFSEDELLCAAAVLDRITEYFNGFEACGGEQ